jgi:imidazolonepropionase-like amidohydrolase
VYTVSGPILDGATILCKNGKILRIGDDVPLPPDTEVLDARGRFVYPGLIAVSAAGIHGGGDPTDTTDVFGLAMNIALAGGITTAVNGDTAAKLTFGRLDDMVVAKNLFTELRYETRTPLAHAELRADLQRVRDYLRDLAAYEQEKTTNKDAKEPAKDWIKGKYENYLKLLKRETVAVINASDTHALVDICGLAEKFGFRLVIRGAEEAWIVPTALARAGASAIITPRDWIDPDERLVRRSGTSVETGAILYKHGVPVAVIPGINSVTTWGVAGRDLLHLNMEAAFAVRGGMTNDQALRSVTLDAARVLGLSDRIGSLEEGKDADMVVADGDILSYMTQVHHTIVNGRVAYDKAKDVLYSHIRPEGKAVPVEFDDLWPRRLEWPREETDPDDANG